MMAGSRAPDIAGLAIAGLVVALASGCGGGDPPPTVSQPVAADPSSVAPELTITPMEKTTRPDGREPLSVTALTAADLKLPSLSALRGEAAARALLTVNNVVGPCDPCMQKGMSLARCALDQRDAPACANIPGLIDHVASRAAAGDDQDALVEGARYEDPWYPTPSIEHLDGPRASMGPADAPVVLLLAVDYGSPFMEQSASIWPTLVAGAAGRLRVDLLHAPIPGRHPGAEFAARAVLAAPSDKAWALHQRLLNDHKGLSPPKLIDAFREVGLDPAATKKALDQPGIGDALNGERAIVEARGVRASPTVFVNGYRARGLRDAADYQAMIDRELGKLK